MHEAPEISQKTNPSVNKLTKKKIRLNDVKILPFAHAVKQLQNILLQQLHGGSGTVANVNKRSKNFSGRLHHSGEFLTGKI